MGEFNVNKSDGSLEQTAGMPSEYPATQVMLSDDVTSVEDALDGLTEDSGWVAINSSYLWYRKIGAVVNVIVKTPSQSTSGWTLIGTLPEGARPYKAIYQCPYIESSYYNLMINTDGEVYYYQTSNGTITGNFVFIA